MLDKGIRVLNFDNSIIAQRKLFSAYLNEIVDFRSLASSARLFMSPVVRKKISDTLPHGGKNYPYFLGSGDFHHISEILISRINEPASLVVFDFHPDWDILPPRFGCGSWVKQALKNKNISKCVLIGMGSGDLTFPALQTADLGALADNRLEVYPYRLKPSRVYFRHLAANQSISVEKCFFSEKIVWRQLEKEDLAVFTRELIRRLPTDKVYISIDKDCMQSDYALTNWEEGLLSLEQLLIMLEAMRENLDIIGLDVVGDYSAFEFKNKIKALVSRLDHPNDATGNSCPEDLISSVNQQVNLAILQTLFP